MRGIQELPSFVIFILVAGVIFTVGGIIMGKMMDKQTSGSEAEAIANYSVQAIREGSSWQDLIVIVGIAALLISLVVGSFMYFTGRR